MRMSADDITQAHTAEVDGIVIGAFDRSDLRRRSRPRWYLARCSRRLRTQRTGAELGSRSAVALPRLVLDRGHGAQPRCDVPAVGLAPRARRPHQRAARRRPQLRSDRRGVCVARCAPAHRRPRAVRRPRSGWSRSRSIATASRSSTSLERGVDATPSALRARRSSPRAEHPGLGRRFARHPHARLGIEGASGAGRGRWSRRRRAT